MRVAVAAACLLTWTTVNALAAAAPTAQTLQQVLTRRLLELKPTGFSERQVLFQQVTPGQANGAYHPFMVTAIIRDYGPGYPANGYFGQTCVGRIPGWKFDLVPDDFGGWSVQGRMTPTDTRECKDNPAQGVSAFPLNTLQGTQAAASAPAPAAAPAAARPAGAASPLYMGEYACYGRGGLMAGMGFKLQPNGRYSDVDGARGGTYAYNAAAASVSFRGGFLDGQTGSKVTPRGTFDISATVNCEPWR